MPVLNGLLAKQTSREEVEGCNGSGRMQRQGQSLDSPLLLLSTLSTLSEPDFKLMMDVILNFPTTEIQRMLSSPLLEPRASKDFMLDSILLFWVQVYRGACISFFIAGQNIDTKKGLSNSWDLAFILHQLLKQVCLFTNPVWLVKTRLQIQTPGSGARQPYSGFLDALRTILRDEGWRAFYKGLGPSLLLVSHGAIQFTTYEEARKVVTTLRNKQRKDGNIVGDKALTSVDYAALGALSKIFAALLTYPYQVIRARVQQRPNSDGLPKYRDSYHAFKETLRFEGIRGLYKGIGPNLLKNVPASSITFLVYESVLRFLK